MRVAASNPSANEVASDTETRSPRSSTVQRHGERRIPRARLLVIDDEPLIGTTLTYALEDEYDVVVTTSGRAALALLAQDPLFDLVLCDLTMPGMGGPAVYEAISRDYPELAPRFVFMTGGAFTEGMRSFLEEHPGARLEKPFAIHDLERFLSHRV